MSRDEVIKCFNAQQFTPEFITDWLQDKVPGDKIGEALNLILQQGFLPPVVLEDMGIKHQVNKVISKEGRIIMYY